MDGSAVKLFALLWFIRVIASEKKGFVSEVLRDKKFDCQSNNRKVFTVQSEMQCTHRCLQNNECEVLNFNTKKEVIENCEVFNGASDCSIKKQKYGWKGLKLQRSTTTKVYRSCKDIYNANPSSVSGVFDLEIGKHHCLMERSNGACGGGGWTLALKVDGTKMNLKADSVWWTNDDVYNVEDGLKSFYQNEAKFSAFNDLSFDDVCIGIKVSADIRWIRLPGISRKSLRSIFKAGTELPTSSGRDAWKGLITSSSLQPNCNKEGFNMKDGDSSSLLLRLGYVANEQDDCNSCDSFIGVGASDMWSISCGNIAAASPDNGDRNTPAMCYLLVK